MRVLSDDALGIGDRLELDLLPDAGDPIRLWAKVVWMESVERVLSQHVVWKVFQVRSHDAVGMSGNRGSENMTIVSIR